MTAAVGNLFAGGSWSLGLSQWDGTLFELLGILGGVAFGLAFLNSPLAIVLYFVIPIGVVDPRRDDRPHSTSRPSGSTPAARWRRSPKKAMTGADWARLGDRDRAVGRPAVRDRTAPAAQD